MRISALLYHDVVGDEGFEGSGVPGGDAHIYKLTREAFAAHVAAVSEVARPDDPLPALLGETGAADVAGAGAGRRASVLFTFDDGGVSALTHTAPLLEARGWRGYFFVTTDWLGRPGFLDEAQVRELHRRGHVIGSHSCSHPPRIAACDDASLRREWRDSVARLADVLGAPVLTASVPGGFYSTRVADTAHEAGVRVLFTSEPTRAVHRRGDLALVGRFAVMRKDDAALPRALAAGARGPAVRQAVFWGAKKVVKRVGGERWLAFRRRFYRNG